MFGMGFTEILLIAIVAILFLGPDKLPDAMVQIAKFIKGAKKAITEAKSSLDEEINVEELKREALEYKAKLNEATAELEGFKNINPLNSIQESIMGDSPKERFESMTQQEPVATQIEEKQKEITFKKKKVTETTIEDIKKENKGSDD